MSEFDALLTQWSRGKRELSASDQLAPRVLSAVRDSDRPSESFDFHLPSPLATPICLAIGLFKFAFVLQIAF